MLPLSFHTSLFLKYIYPVLDVDWKGDEKSPRRFSFTFLSFLRPGVFLLHCSKPSHHPLLPPCVPLSKPLSSWNISWHISNPAGCAGRERRVSWRAQRPSSPSWCGKYSEDSGLDRAAETQTTAGPILPCCFFLKGEGCKSMRESLQVTFFFCRCRINDVQSGIHTSC